jgi:hypothetical protein
MNEGFVAPEGSACCEPGGLSMMRDADNEDEKVTRAVFVRVAVVASIAVLLGGPA